MGGRGEGGEPFCKKGFHLPPACLAFYRFLAAAVGGVSGNPGAEEGTCARACVAQGKASAEKKRCGRKGLSERPCRLPA